MPQGHDQQRERLRAAAQAEAMKALRVWSDQKRAAETLRLAVRALGPDARVMPLKGTLLARLYYEHPSERPLTDCDVLILSPSQRLAVSRLSAAGFELIQWGSSSKVVTMRRSGGKTLDLDAHFRPLPVGLGHVTCRWLAEAVLDDAAGLGFRAVQLTGGDPLMSPSLVAAVEHAYSRGIESVEIFTNGLALNEELYAQLIMYPVTFALSVYSIDSHAHDAITRTAGSHAATIGVLERLVSIGVGVRAAIIEMAENAGHTGDTIDWLIAKGITLAAISVDCLRTTAYGAADVPTARQVAQAARASMDQAPDRHWATRSGGPHL